MGRRGGGRPRYLGCYGAGAGIADFHVAGGVSDPTKLHSLTLAGTFGKGGRNRDVKPLLRFGTGLLNRGMAVFLVSSLSH